jgi:hypothetical protein
MPGAWPQCRAGDASVRCLGYDLDGQEFDCPNEAGTPWTKFWCLPCDERRRARITHQLEEIQRHFEEL